MFGIKDKNFLNDHLLSMRVTELNENNEEDRLVHPMLLISQDSNFY